MLSAAAIAAGVSSALRSGEPDPPRLVALVIANRAYPDAPLQNPVIDTGLVGKVLNASAFGRPQPTRPRRIRAGALGFRRGEQGRGRRAVLFRRARLLDRGRGPPAEPPDVDIREFSAKTAIALEGGGEPLEHVEETIIGHARATLIFIDACRNVPALASRGVGSRGFAPIDSSNFEGAYVVLSTRQGKTAEDGPGGQGSPFARAFARVLPTPGLRIEDTYARIREKVRADTHGEQVPDIIRSDLPEGGVVLMPTGGSPSTPVAMLEFNPANGCSGWRFGVKGDRLPGNNSAGGVEIRAAAVRARAGGRTARFRDDPRRPRAKDRSE